MDLSCLPCVKQFNSAKHFLEYLEIDKAKDEPIKFAILLDNQMREYKIKDYNFIKKMYKSLFSRSDTQRLRYTDLFYLQYRYLIYNCSYCYNTGEEYLGGRNVAISKLTNISNLAAFLFFKLFFGKLNTSIISDSIKNEVFSERDRLVTLLKTTCKLEGFENLIDMVLHFQFLQIAQKFSHNWYLPIIDSSFQCYELLMAIHKLITYETFDRTQYELERTSFLSRLYGRDYNKENIEQPLSVSVDPEKPPDLSYQLTPNKDFSLSYLNDFTYDSLPMTPAQKFREKFDYSIIPETPPNQVTPTETAGYGNSMKKFDKTNCDYNENVLVTSSPVIRKSLSSVLTPDVKYVKLSSHNHYNVSSSVMQIVENDGDEDEILEDDTLKGSNSGFNFNIPTDTKVNKSVSNEHLTCSSSDSISTNSIAMQVDSGTSSKHVTYPPVDVTITSLANKENSSLLPIDATSDSMNVSLCYDVISDDNGEPVSYGPYKFLRMLGQGSFSQVFEAIKKDCCKTFAVKIIKFGSHIRMKEINMEIQILNKMSSSGRSAILYESKITGGEAILVMEKAQMNMKEFMDSKAKDVDHIFILHYFKLMMLCVEALHLERMAHLDLKMQNFVITDNSDVKLIDYGTSKVLPQYISVAENDERVGTVVFMAPEVMIGESDLNPKRADMWSMGIVLYFMVYQQQPCNATTITDYMRRMCNPNFVFNFPEVPCRYNGLLSMIMKRCLMYNHNARPSATEVIQFMSPGYPSYNKT